MLNRQPDSLDLIALIQITALKYDKHVAVEIHCFQDLKLARAGIGCIRH